MVYIWNWFVDLDDARPSGYGVSPISHESIQAFQLNYDLQMDAFEVRAIRAMDAALRAEISREADK